MLAHETVLRQRYSLSFLTTTLLIALTTQPSLAFSINPLGPSGATDNWVPSQSYAFGVTTLNPSVVRSLPRGGTVGFLLTLKAAFPNWTFKPAPNDLTGSFKVIEYAAEGSILQVGGKLTLEYIPGLNDPPLSTSQHWIQRVFDNHNITDSPGHNNYELVIDTPFGVNNPYYDGSPLQPLEKAPFSDFSKREDAYNNHNWSAELYLVEENSPQNVTIYNGIEWGWNNVVTVPEPFTIFGSGMGLGMGVFFKKYSQRHKKTKNLEKLKT
jgi:hypothetical protein